jgi:hypothetical protein
MKHRSSLESPRLQAVLAVIEAAGDTGATTRQIMLEADVNDVKDVIYELRWHGVQIASIWESRRGKNYRRYWLADNSRAVA